MASIETKSTDRPDERRTPEKTEVSVVHLGDAAVARLSLEPGWTWASCIEPVVGTESCQAAHLGYVVTGAMHVTADDGTEGDLQAGDAYRLQPGPPPPGGGGPGGGTPPRTTARRGIFRRGTPPGSSQATTPKWWVASRSSPLSSRA